MVFGGDRKASIGVQLNLETAEFARKVDNIGNLFKPVEVPLTVDAPKLNTTIEASIGPVSAKVKVNGDEIRTQLEAKLGAVKAKAVFDGDATRAQLEAKLEPIKVRAVIDGNQPTLSLNVADGTTGALDGVGDAIASKVGKAVEKAQPHKGIFSGLFSGIGSLVSNLVGLIAYPLKEAVSGVLLGVGLPLGEKLGHGLTQGIEQELSNIIGSFDFVSRTVGATFAQELVNSYIEKVPTLKKIFSELGQEAGVDVKVEAAAVRGQARERSRAVESTAKEQVTTESRELLSPEGLTQTRVLRDTIVQEETLLKEYADTVQAAIAQFEEPFQIKEKTQQIATIARRITQLNQEIKEGTTERTPEIDKELGDLTRQARALSGELKQADTLVQQQFRTEFDRSKQFQEQIDIKGLELEKRLAPLELLDRFPDVAPLPKSQQANLTAQQKSQELINRLVAKIGKISGFQAPTQELIPAVVIDKQLEAIQGAKGSYNPEKNIIRLAKSISEQIEQGTSLLEKDIEIIAHELVHAYQHGFGKIKIFEEQLTPADKPTAQELSSKELRLPEHIEASVRGGVTAAQQQGRSVSDKEASNLRTAETDAYVRGIRMRKQLTEEIQREDVVNKLGNVLGVSNQNILNFFSNLRKQAIQIKTEVDTAAKSYAGLSSSGSEGEALAQRIYDDARKVVERNIEILSTESFQFFDELKQIDESFIAKTPTEELNEVAEAITQQLQDFTERVTQPLIALKAEASQALALVKGQSTSASDTAQEELNQSVNSVVEFQSTLAQNIHQATQKIQGADEVSRRVTEARATYEQQFKVLYEEKLRTEKLKGLLNSTKEIAELSNSPTFNKIVENIANISNVKTPSKLPQAGLASGSLLQRVIQGGMAGFYNPTSNIVALQHEAYEALRTGQKPDKSFGELLEIVSTLTHELRHSAQYGMGELSIGDIKQGNIGVKLLKATEEELKVIGSAIETSVRGYTGELPEEMIRQLEEDAYTFELRYTKAIMKSLGWLNKDFNLLEYYQGIGPEQDVVQDIAKEIGVAESRIFRALSEKVAQVSNVALPQEMERLPQIAIPQGNLLKGFNQRGANAAYLGEINRLIIKPETVEALESGTFNTGHIRTLIHEYRHALQNKLGKITQEEVDTGNWGVELLTATKSEWREIGDRVMGSVKSATASGNITEEVARTLEEDAYTFELRYGQAITEHLKEVYKNPQLTTELHAQASANPSIQEEHTLAPPELTQDTGVDAELEELRKLMAQSPLEEIVAEARDLVVEVHEVVTEGLTQDTGVDAELEGLRELIAQSPLELTKGLQGVVHEIKENINEGVIAAKSESVNLSQLSKQQLTDIIKSSGFSQAELLDFAKSKGYKRTADINVAGLREFAGTRINPEDLRFKVPLASQVDEQVQEEAKNLVQLPIKELKRTISHQEKLLNQTIKEGDDISALRQSLGDIHDLQRVYKAALAEEVGQEAKDALSQAIRRLKKPERAAEVKLAPLAAQEAQGLIQRQSFNAPVIQSQGDENLARVNLGAIFRPIPPEQQTQKLGQQFKSAEMDAQEAANNIELAAAKIDKAETQINSRLESSGDTKFGTKLLNAFEPVDKFLGKFGLSFQDLTKHALSALKGFLAFQALNFIQTQFSAIARSAFETQVRMENLTTILDYANDKFGGSQAAMGFVTGLADKYKVPLEATAQGYAKFAAATRNSAIEGEKTNQIMEALAQTSTVLNFTQEQTSGTILAFSQAISGSTIHLEELNQMTDRIPGFMGIAARAVGKTQFEFRQLVEQGQIIADDFLPKLGRQLKIELGANAEAAATNAQSAIFNLQNAWLKFQSAIGQAIMPIAIPGLNTAAAGLTELTKHGQELRIVVEVLGSILIAALAPGLINVVKLLWQTVINTGLAKAAMQGFSGATLSGFATMTGGILLGVAAFESVMDVVNLLQNDGGKRAAAFTDDVTKNLQRIGNEADKAAGKLNDVKNAVPENKDKLTPENTLLDQVRGGFNAAMDWSKDNVNSQLKNFAPGIELPGLHLTTAAELHADQYLEKLKALPDAYLQAMQAARKYADVNDPTVGRVKAIDTELRNLSQSRKDILINSQGKPNEDQKVKLSSIQRQSDTLTRERSQLSGYVTGTMSTIDTAIKELEKQRDDLPNQIGKTVKASDAPQVLEQLNGAIARYRSAKGTLLATVQQITEEDETDQAKLLKDFNKYADSLKVKLQNIEKPHLEEKTRIAQDKANLRISDETARREEFESEQKDGERRQALLEKQISDRKDQLQRSKDLHFQGQPGLTPEQEKSVRDEISEAEKQLEQSRADSANRVAANRKSEIQDFVTGTEIKNSALDRQIKNQEIAVKGQQTTEIEGDRSVTKLKLQQIDEREKALRKQLSAVAPDSLEAKKLTEQIKAFSNERADLAVDLRLKEQQFIIKSLEAQTAAYETHIKSIERDLHAHTISEIGAERQITAERIAELQKRREAMQVELTGVDPTTGKKVGVGLNPNSPEYLQKSEQIKQSMIEEDDLRVQLANKERQERINQLEARADAYNANITLIDNQQAAHAISDINRERLVTREKLLQQDIRRQALVETLKNYNEQDAGYLQTQTKIRQLDAETARIRIDLVNKEREERIAQLEAEASAYDNYKKQIEILVAEQHLGEMAAARATTQATLDQLDVRRQSMETKLTGLNPETAAYKQVTQQIEGLALERRGAIAKLQQQERDQALKHYDNLRRVEEERYSHGIIGQAQYNQELLESDRTQKMQQILQLQEHMEKLAATDEEGREAIRAQIAEAFTQYDKIITEYYDREIQRAQEQAQKRKDVETLEELKAGTAIQHRILLGEMTEKQADEARLAATRTRVKGQMEAEQAYINFLQSLPQPQNEAERLKRAKEVNQALSERERLQQEQDKNELQIRDKRFGEEERVTKKRFEESQQVQAKYFQQQQQLEQEKFRQSQEAATKRFNDQQRDEEKRFQEGLQQEKDAANRKFDAIKSEVERRLQLENAKSPGEKRKLEKQFADEDKKAVRKREIERDVLAESTTSFGEGKSAFSDRIPLSDRLNDKRTDNTQNLLLKSPIEQAQADMEEGFKKREEVFQKGQQAVADARTKRDQADNDAFTNKQQQQQDTFQKQQQNESLIFEEFIQERKRQYEAEWQKNRATFEETLVTYKSTSAELERNRDMENARVIASILGKSPPARPTPGVVGQKTPEQTQADYQRIKTTMDAYRTPNPLYNADATTTPVRQGAILGADRAIAPTPLQPVTANQGNAMINALQQLVDLQKSQPTPNQNISITTQRDPLDATLELMRQQQQATRKR